MDKYIWLVVAALCGGVVSQYKKGGSAPWWRRLCHLVAGAMVAVYLSPLGIKYFELAGSDGQYLVPFAIGAFWFKLFEALEKSLDSIKFPWGN